MQPTILGWETLEEEQRTWTRRARRIDVAFAALTGRRPPSGSDDYANEALEQMRRERIRAVHGGERAAVLRPHRRRGRRSTSGATPSGAPDNDLLSVNWRAPAAVPFYAATAHDPQGIRRAPAAGHRGPHGARLRRRDAGDRGRRPPDRGDRRGHHAPARRRDAPDHLDDHARPVRADQPRQRGRARDPGRARHRQDRGRACTARRGCCTPTRSSRAPGVLVVGPNETFIRYIEQVLPALGEGGVEQRPIGSLITRPHGEVDETRELASLKGSARIAVDHGAAAVGPAEASRAREIPFGRRRVSRSRREDLQEIVAAVRERTFSYEAGRERFRERLAGIRRVARARPRLAGRAGGGDQRGAQDQGVPAPGDQGVAAGDARGPGREAVQEPRAAGARGRRPALGRGARRCC